LDQFSVDLPAYRGPLDLLLYLVRRQEVDLQSLSLADLVQQYSSYLDVLSALDIDGAAEFLEMASALVELKSRECLPQHDEEGGDDQALDDPRGQLIERLLEYRGYRDAASMLDELSARWQQRYPRLAVELPERNPSLVEQPLAPLEIWDLVSAFGRILRETRSLPAERVIFDETPISHYMMLIHGQLRAGNRISFTELLAAGMHKSALIGLFLAMLELTRHHGVLVQQDELSSEIILVPGPNFPENLAVTEAALSSISDSPPPAPDPSAPD